MKYLFLAGFALALIVPAVAQSGDNPAPIREIGPHRVTTPFFGQEKIVQGVPGSPENSGPGADEVVEQSGLGADNFATDTAITSNSNSTERGIPNLGGGGGEDGGGQ
ncbi:hypothetical protein [Methylobacterium sp. ID0610]|uniref:hypothetical protein n=1 Tax=Methylobacterium carpenticola TaxID=3344827 RepID=UPI0036C29901